MASLTAANAVITLAVANLFSVPRQLQGFAADNVYEAADQQVVETAMGVDGLLSGGFVFNPVDQTFVLQADSASNAIFEQWAAAQVRAKDVYVANGQTVLPSLRRQYVSTRGFLISLPPIPSAGRILGARRYLIRWQSVLSVPQ